jgi:hypothetical protein
MGAVQEAAIRDERRMDRGGKPVVESLPEPPCGIGRTSGKRKKTIWPKAMGRRLRIRFATANDASFERVKVYPDSGNTSQQAAIA